MARMERNGQRALFSTCLAFIAAFFVTFAWPSGASAGEYQTTHRVGDKVFYSMGCHDADSAIAIGTAGKDPVKMQRVLNLLYVQQKCFRMGMPLSAELTQWVDGHFVHFSGRIGSVWKLLDAVGDEEFAVFYDNGGLHEAVDTRSAS